jgi:hypothetical protein
MSTKYLVLRTDVPVDESFSFSTSRSWGASKGGPRKLDICTMEGHETDVGQLRADPRNVAVMDAEVVAIKWLTGREGACIFEAQGLAD